MWATRPEYNHVQLRVEGNQLRSDGHRGWTRCGHWHRAANLSTSTLYDFSREGLGNNFALRIPLATFRYLHVSITPAIPTREIVGASTSVHRESQAKWISAGRCHSSEQVGPHNPHRLRS